MTYLWEYRRTLRIKSVFICGCVRLRCGCGAAACGCGAAAVRLRAAACGCGCVRLRAAACGCGYYEKAFRFFKINRTLTSKPDTNTGSMYIRIYNVQNLCYDLWVQGCPRQFPKPIGLFDHTIFPSILYLAIFSFNQYNWPFGNYTSLQSKEISEFINF